MRTALFLSLLLLTPPVLAQQTDGIESTIRSQMDAFRADDFAGAFSYASPTIKGLFMTPENFGMMVRNGYPMVHRPADVRMLDRREVAGHPVQRVMVTDAAGRTHLLDYEMLDTPEGWQINGVFLVPSPGTGA